MTDSITRDILGNAFSAIAAEMAVVEYRSSYSPIIREMLDFTCGLFDRDGRMIAHAEQIPAQLGLMQFALQTGVARRGGPLRRGDVMIANHPYLGGTHTPDLQLFAPIYADGELLAYAGSIAHHIDVGGANAGTESAGNTDILQEGLLFPAVLLHERGRRCTPLYELIEANVRDPHATLGDLDAQLAALRRGEQRILELVDRYGRAVVTGAIDHLLETTSRRTSAEFAAWGERSVEAEGFMDDDGTRYGEPLRIRVRLQVRRGELFVDLTGSSEQRRAGVNVPWASTHAGIYFAVRCFAREAVRQNDGLTRHIHVTAPEGSLLNPRPPAAVSVRHVGVQRLSDVMIEALSDLLPDRAVAASHVSFPTFVVEAIDPRTGARSVITDILGGGGGARRDAAGDPAIDSYTSNCALLPAEICELDYPLRVEQTALVTGSGGAGAYAGGAGMVRDYTVLAEEAEGIYYVEQTNPAFTAKGRDGGAAGSTGGISLRRAGETAFRQLPGKGSIELRRGDTLRLLGASGGGFGAVR